MGWEVDPTGLEEILERVTEDYQPPAIYVTENGSAYVDTVDDAGDVGDPERIAYLESHVAACAQAVERGVPLKGYYAWSLLDNFEWAYGYDKRFGLVRVDFETRERTVKAGGWRYASLISEHQAVARLRPAVRDSA